MNTLIGIIIITVSVIINEALNSMLHNDNSASNSDAEIIDEIWERR